VSEQCFTSPPTLHSVPSDRNLLAFLRVVPSETHQRFLQNMSGYEKVVCFRCTNALISLKRSKIGVRLLLRNIRNTRFRLVPKSLCNLFDCVMVLSLNNKKLSYRYTLTYLRVVGDRQ